MQRMPACAGHAPEVRVGALLVCAGPLGRTARQQGIDDPEAQFAACRDRLCLVLAGAGRSFQDVVGLTTCHVERSRHIATFRTVKDRVLPRGTCAGTATGTAKPACRGLLPDSKRTARRRPGQGSPGDGPPE